MDTFELIYLRSAYARRHSTLGIHDRQSEDLRFEADPQSGRAGIRRIECRPRAKLSIGLIDFDGRTGWLAEALVSEVIVSRHP